MPDAEPIFSAEQIRIPLLFPDILKNFSKYIIKHQPNDIIFASAEYFNNLQRQKELNKSVDGGSPLTREQLESVYFKFNLRGQSNVAHEAVVEVSNESLISASLIEDIYRIGGWEINQSIEWIHFWGVCLAMSAGTLLATSLLGADILSNNGTVVTSVLADLVRFLALTDGQVPVDSVSKCIGELLSYGHNAADADIVTTLKRYL